MALNKTGWVVTSFQIRYLAPALMNELVVIESALVHYDAASLWVEAIMYDQKRERIKALAWMQFAYIDAQTGRRTEHDEAFTTLLAAVLVPEHPASGVTFEQRGAALKAESRQRAAGAE